MVKNNRITLFGIINYCILALCAMVTLYPFWYVLVVSITGYNAYINTSLLFYPKQVTFDAYKIVFANGELYRSFLLTAAVVVIFTVLHVLLGIMAAYTLSKKYLPGRNILLAIVVLPMIFSSGVIPRYLMVRSMHLMNTFFVLILIGLFSAYNIILMKNFLGSVPDALEESAKIDGAEDFCILFRIYLPLSMPIIATIGLFAAVGKWNDYQTALYYITDSRLYPLQNVLRSMLIEGDIDVASGGFGTSEAFKQQEAVKMATIIVSTLPVIIIYPFVQKHFVKGVMLGSVKG